MKIGLVPVALAFLLAACGETTPEPAPVAADPAPADPGARVTATEPEAPASPATPTPRQPTVRPGALTFEQLVVDFGPVDDTRTLTCAFPFENTQDEVIHVTEMKASCGCTTPGLVKRTFQPGESDVIEVNWDPKGQGAQTQTVDVFTRDAKAPTRLYVKAQIRPRVRPTPGAADFGEVAQNTAQAMMIHLEADEPVEVLGARGETSHVLADFVPAGGRPTTGRLGMIDVRLKPTSRRGPLATSVVLDLRVPGGEGEEPHDYQFKVPVRAKVFGAIKADPAGFYVSRVDPGGEVDFTVRLRRPGGGSFGLTTCELLNSTVPGLEVRQETGSDEEGFFIDATVHGSVGDYLGSIRGQVRILSDVPGDSLLTLAVLGLVRPAGG